MGLKIPPAFQRLPAGKKRTFLLAYARLASLRQAGDEAECHHTDHYYWMETDPVYAELFPLAKAMSADSVEDEITRRGMGWEEERYTDDGMKYTIQKYSDLLLIFRMKALKPQEYRDNSHVSVESTSTLTVTIEDRTRQANDRLETLRREHQHVIPDPLG